MREAPIRKLLGLLAQAEPKEVAAIYGFARRLLLAGPRQGAPGSQPRQVAAARKDCAGSEVLTFLARIEGKVDAVRKTQRASGAVEPDHELPDEELRKVYARVLLTSARRSRGREAPLKEVFDRYCLDGLSAKKVSEVLGCAKSTVMLRLAALKQIAGVSAAALRAYKPFFERAEKSLRDPRARRRPVREAALGDETRDSV